MALVDPKFAFAFVALLYISSFIVFAIIRHTTGISIQRIGYLSLRRLAYTPRDGCEIKIRGLGLSIHRPTFAQPTWLSLVISELIVTVDIRQLEGQKVTDINADEPSIAKKTRRATTQNGEPIQLPKKRPLSRASTFSNRSETWKKLSKIKDKLKKLHSKVEWIRMVDVVATNSTINVTDVGQIQVGSFTMAVDTRRKMVDRARFFFQRSEARKQERQAEWIMTIRSVLFTADGKESLEVLDHGIFNVHGFLYQTKEGLRDTTVALKLGRVHIPFDDLHLCAGRYKDCRSPKAMAPEAPSDVFMDNVVHEEESEATSTSEDLIRTVSDSKEFIASILRGIKEVQFAVGFVGVTKTIHSIKPAANPLQLSAMMKEIGIDMHRLDPNSPAHRMYFPSQDIAHEALVAALSITVGLDDGHDKPERLVYVPMATTTVRTTLPSKTIELPRDRSVEERNTNIVFSNTVITSPSVDLDPRHLPILIALLKPKPKPYRAHQEKRRWLIPRLLPKTISKVTMHEPVVRIKLKPLTKSDDAGDFDLIISSISSISFDMESSHSPIKDSHYALNGTLRVLSHHLYYQTVARERFNLITTDSFDLKVHLSASPDISVDASGDIKSFSISMTRPEITDGLRQIVRELRIDVEPEKRAYSKTGKHTNFLRSIPPWLARFHVEANDVNVEVAGVDEDISDDTRGVCLHWDTLSAEYQEQKGDGQPQRPPRTRTHSRTITTSDSDLTPSPMSPRAKVKGLRAGDGRRLAFHARGIEAQIIESTDKLEEQPFLAIPRLELAFSATSDGHGPMFHIAAAVRTIMFQYSLYRHYSVGVATMTLRKAFMKTGRDVPRAKQFGTAHNMERLSSPPPTMKPLRSETQILSASATELVTIDIKVSLVQVKAELPHEPTMMLHIYGLETGRYRWSTPYMTAKLMRMYVSPPRMDHVWARIISVKSCRIDLRESKRKTATGFIKDRMVDISSDAMRIGVPHEVVVNRITDNCINVFKAVLQLHHRFKTGTNEYILEKHAEAAKHVPKISLRTRNFLFELEDGAFEWKLGMIYRTGRIEQVQRIAREEAFKAKMSRIREEESRRGGPSRVRSRSAYTRGRSDHSGGSWFRSRSVDTVPVSPTDSGPGPSRPRIPRYDPDGETLGVNGNSKVSEEDARRHLEIFNSQTWKKRIDKAYEISQKNVRDMRSTFWGPDNLPDDIEETENILEVPLRPALMSTMITDLHVVIDKPTFDLSELPDFLHEIGKGMPRDMEYSLLVPMHLSIEMDEARMSLRDYPLPFLHIPAMKTGQSTKVTAVSIKTNFVIAEEFRGPESNRKVLVNIVPPKSSGPDASNSGSFAIEVRRTVSPVKTYSQIWMDINTALPTRITWAPCYQPAIQDMMMVVESFTKPPVDTSEPVGFWDKLRLICHSRIHVAWKGDGGLHLALKGTRDPYQVTGNGAGFLMCWRKDVRWNIHTEDDPKRFMTVDSGEYILAVPDYTHQVREIARRQEGDTSSGLNGDSMASGAIFKKVVMKLSGKVQWMCGLVFEQAIENGRRNFSFRPHYDIVLKSPQFAKSKPGLPYDSMRGFRSRHIHLSIAVRAPADFGEGGPSTSYNTVHLTPRFFTHFFAWWALFGQPLSLPIRQGNLFPGREKTSKKFGRHLATIKYNLIFAPLYLSHIYKHKDAEDYSESEGAVSATGLKVRFDSFMLDLHQRREEFNTLVRAPGRNGQSRTTGIKIHAAQLDLACADLRAVSASLKGTTTEAIQRGSLSTLIADQDEKPDLSRFTIPDNDYSWIDMDDFVELDWILPTEPHPNTKILPLAYAPRLTYFRQTDINGTISGDPTRTSPFGNEPTHYCVMSHDDDPKQVQEKLIEERLEQLRDQMSCHSRTVGETELKVIKSNAKDPALLDDFDVLKKHTNVLQEKEAFLRGMLEQLQAQSLSGSRFSPHRSAHRDGNSRTGHEHDSEDDMLNIPNNTEFESEFTNRFILHNMQLKWNNVLRNIVLRYIHQNSQRRGFIYYLSRPAVKFILDIVEEQNRARNGTPSPQMHGTKASTPEPAAAAPERDKSDDIEERIRNIIGSGHKYHGATFCQNTDGTTPGMDDLTCGISDDFSPQSSYHVRLIAPQIQLQSEKNKKHVVLVTAKGMELKVIEVMDKERISDDVSGLVQRRFLVNMDSTQFFVTHHKWFMTSLVSMYAGNRYGTKLGSAWPPWVPMEVMFDFQAAPFGFKRVVQKTSAMLRYDKYNTLRLKYNDEVNAEGDDETPHESSQSQVDNLWVEFPQARAICNSSQYYAMYVIVLDLLMYSEPLEKTRSERLEKIMLASDFSDLSGAPEKIQQLQERIRQMEEIKTHFQIYSKYLDKRGWEDRLALERDLAASEDELFFVMKAITTSQRKFDVNASNNALLKWNISVRNVVWHLMQDSNEALVELQLKDLEYDRTDNSDGSHMNLIRIGKLLGLNLLPDATYPEIIAPYHDNGEREGSGQMIRVYWNMLEAIAGIPVMDRFEVDLYPMKIQLEHEVGKRLFEYIFPGMDGSDKMSTSKNDGHNEFKQNLAEAEPETEEESLHNSTSQMPTPRLEADSSGFSTRAGSLELRLRPTLTSNVPDRVPKKTALTVHTGDTHGFRLFNRGGTSKSLVKKSSQESLRVLNQPKPGNIPRSSTGLSKDSNVTTTTSDTRKRFGLGIKRGDDRQLQSDDLTKMISRASNYMTFVVVRMPSVVLCLSYKGRKQSNFEDVHDFVFRLPTIEWQNKTWSNLDLALAVKKAVVKALISHTGAIIGNKFSKHRPNAAQRDKLREIANSAVMMTPSAAGSQQYAGSINDSDDSSSMYGNSPVDFSRSPPRSLRGSTHSSIPAPRSTSRSSSIASNRSYQNTTGTFLTMTPPTPTEGRRDSGQGIGSSLLQPSVRNGNGRSITPINPAPRRVGTERPQTSASNMPRRKSGTASGFRDKLGALAQRMGHRESSSSSHGQQDDDVVKEKDDDEPDVVNGANGTTTNGLSVKTSPGKKSGWSVGRTKTGY